MSLLQSVETVLSVVSTLLRCQVSSGLDAVQFCVCAAFGNQLFVAADLDNPSAIQNDD